MSKLRDKIQGELEKLPTGFQYVKGSICSLSSDDDDSVSVDMLQEALTKGEVLCPRCENHMKQDTDGRWRCPQDGLVLTKEIQKKFGLKI